MLRALWTGASGMTSQQLQVDTISNNIANVNTVGYKQETVTFKSLLYQTMEQPNVEGVQQPAALQVGHGVRPGANIRTFTQGSLLYTGNGTDIALEGEGFFAVADGDDVAYTRDGSFRFSTIDEGESFALATSEGRPVLSVEGEPIIIDGTVPMEKIGIDSSGMISYTEEETGMQIELGQIQIVQFGNVEGLEALGDNLYAQTPASGEPLLEAENEGLKQSNVVTGYLEGSNVNIANEMVNLIVAQRAYEMNSKVIQTADTMLQQANDLKRS